MVAEYPDDPVPPERRPIEADIRETPADGTIYRAECAY